MTFLEAAIEVLRSSEEPLHYIDITRLAVERKLLSHVGRDPEAAMQTCLNSAVRSRVHDGIVMRSKPGHFRLREGVAVPELPPAPTGRKALPDVNDDENEPAPAQKKASKSKKKATSSSKDSRGSRPEPKRTAKVSEAASPKRDPKPKTSSRSRQPEVETSEPDDPSEVDELEADELDASDGADDDGDQDDAGDDAGEPIPMPELDPSKVRFRGPNGSGLEDDTDVALVMANAMSRLVDERPEFREELEAMQKGQAPVPEVIEVGRKKRGADGRDSPRTEDREREREREREQQTDEGGGRRRRRRRRRGRRVEWSDTGGGPTARAVANCSTACAAC